jgi:hypothetical protein
MYVIYPSLLSQSNIPLLALVISIGVAGYVWSS